MAYTITTPNGSLELLDAGSLKASGSRRDGVAWQTNNEHALRLALGFNNSATPSTVPRIRGFTSNDVTFANVAGVDDDCKQFQFAVFDGRRVLFLPFGQFGSERSTLLAYDVTKDFEDTASYTAVDLETLLDNDRAEGFIGGCLGTDGYLYLCPCSTNESGSEVGSHLFVRFHTAYEVDDADGWEVMDLDDTPPANSGTDTLTAGYSWQYVGTDGRYVYWCPCNAPASPTTAHGEFLRFDTRGDAGVHASGFQNPANWGVFDTTAVHAQALGNLGVPFDGRYIYLVPFARSTGAVTNGRLVRYDTINPAGFYSTESYASVDLEALLTPSTSLTSGDNSARAVGFCGGVVVGPYLVLVPWGGGQTTKRSLAVCYDTRLSLTAASSYKTFDLRTMARQGGSITNVTGTGTTTATVTCSAHGFSVGQRVNIGSVGGATQANGTWQIATVPNANSFTITTESALVAYTSGGTVTGGAEECIGYQGGGFDGQYVHFTPAGNNNRNNTYTVPPYVRWDVRLPFEEAASWSWINTPIDGHCTTAFAAPYLCTGMTFDGRYLYHAPYGAGNPFGVGVIARIDAGAPNLAGMVDPLPELYRGPSKLGNTVVIEDDFNTGNTVTGNVGTIGLQFVTTGTGGSVAYRDAEAGHPGIIRFTSGNTINEVNSVAFRTSASQGTFHLNTNSGFPFDLVWIVRTNAVSAEPTYRIGLSNTPAVAGGQPANGLYFEKLSGDSNFWRIVVRTAGSETRYNTGFAYAASTWYRFRIKWDPPYLKYSVDDSALQAFGSPQQAAGAAWVVPATPTLPTATLTPLVTLVPSTAASQTIDLDYVKLIHFGFSR